MRWPGAGARRRPLLAVGLAAFVGTALLLRPVGAALGGASGAPPIPPLPADRAARPLGTPPAVPVTSAPYAFMQTQPGSGAPVAWDSCRPIHYVVRPDGAPPAGGRLLRDAFADVSAATGLVFVADGTTEEAPSDRRPGYLPQRYGRRWAPVLVAWSSPRETPALAGPVVGQAGPVAYDGRAPASRRYVSGQVVLDGPEVAALLNRPDGYPIARAVVLHELGHLVGLAHVPDRFQLMYAETTPLARDFESGDRQGLAALGAGRCFTDA